MRSYLIAQSKGGVGKTTMTFVLAVEATRNGLATLVIDADHSQKSLTAIMNKRSVAAPALATVRDGGIADALQDATVRSYDRIFVDAPPLLNVDVQELVRAVDKVVMPIQASPLDVEASAPLLQAVQAVGRSYCYVINAADGRRSVVRQVHSVLAAQHPVAPIVGDRADFVTAVGAGQAPFEFSPSSKAAKEIAEVWSYVDA